MFLGRLYKTLIILVFTLSSVSFYTSPRVSSLEDCTESKLRDLGVIVISCEGDNLLNQCSDTIQPGNDNQETAFRFFLGKGLTPEQSAGILGNMIAESGVNPQRVQNGHSVSVSKDPYDAGEDAWGLIQWDPGHKIFGLLEQAGIDIVSEGEKGRHVYDLDVQLDLVWWHLTNVSPTGLKNVLPGLKTTTTITEAVEYFEEKVEGAGKPVIQRRVAFAEQAFKAYSNLSGITLAGSTVGSCAGSATTLDDGFVVYSQYDPIWKDLPYASSTIGASGCGPSAMAMIITSFSNTRVTPINTAGVAAKLGLYVPGSGSKWSIGPELASHYGLKSENIATDIGEISAALQAGKMIITAGKGVAPFTQGGHFIVLRGITDDGKWLIGDSGHNGTSEQEWDPSALINQMNERSGSAYAISK